jgi:hypothetical protein
MDGLSWLGDLNAWADRERAETRRVLEKAGGGEPVTKAHNGNGHGKPVVNRALVRGAMRRRGWTGLAASQAPSPPPAPPPSLADAVRDSDARFDHGKRLLRGDRDP